ncbi:MAG: hypothetical protein LBS86_04800 [Treponema sp.]|jgi:hypothetical protein|nr:hypothetical protein [Treponema sp.]
MSDVMTMEREDVDIRQALKSAIDTWPMQMVLAVRNFAQLETKRHEVETDGDSEQDVARRAAAFKRLSQYFGTVDREINCKQERLEALDERYMQRKTPSDKKAGF